MDACQPGMGDLNNRMGGAFCWASQVLYREDAAQSELIPVMSQYRSEFLQRAERVPHQFP
jgi:hypothetical protein